MCTLDSIIKKNWIEIQKKNTAPVNAIGIKINPKDDKTLKVWKEEGIDQFIKKCMTVTGANCVFPAFAIVIGGSLRSPLKSIARYVPCDMAVSLCPIFRKRSVAI